MQKVNHIAILLDRSGSMHHLTTEVINQFNLQIEHINKLADSEQQKTHVSLYTFSDVADRPLMFDVPLDLVTIKPLSSKVYRAGGGTALFDSVGMAVDDLSQFHKNVKSTEDHSFLVIVLTDGYENTSTKYKNTIAALMSSKMATDVWTFAFSVPHGSKKVLTQSYGIPDGNVQEWDVNSGVTGVQEVSRVTTQSLDNYFAARASGLRSVSKFYTDLSSVTKQDLKQLNDVTAGFRKKLVEKEMDIKTFCTYHFNEYVPGNAFYQLTKEEKRVQDYKKIAIEDKATGKIYGDDRVRGMLGLPTVGDVKIVPGNHSNYNIYIQSTSVNRKLVRGSYLLYHKAAQGASI